MSGGGAGLCRPLGRLVSGGRPCPWASEDVAPGCLPFPSGVRSRASCPPSLSATPERLTLVHWPREHTAPPATAAGLREQAHRWHPHQEPRRERCPPDPLGPAVAAFRVRVECHRHTCVALSSRWCIRKPRRARGGHWAALPALHPGPPRADVSPVPVPWKRGPSVHCASDPFSPSLCLPAGRPPPRVPRRLGVAFADETAALETQI